MPKPIETQPELLRAVLEGYTVPILQSLAKLLTSDLPTRKAELIDLMLSQLQDRAIVQQLWAALDPVQQAAVSEAIHSPSGFDAARFRAKYGRDPDWGTLRGYRGDNPSRLRLLIYGGTVPPDLRALLAGFVPRPRAFTLETLDEPPATISQSRYRYTRNRAEKYREEIPVVRSEMERAAQHDVQAVLRLIDAGKVRASETTKKVSAGGATAIASVLYGGDFYPTAETSDPWTTDPGPIKAFAWPLLVQSAGLANLAGTRMQLTPAGKKALSQPPHEVIRSVWNRWLKTTLLDEFNRVHTIKGQTGKGKRSMTAVAGRRAALVESLRDCPPNRWTAFDEFSRLAHAGHSFAVARDLWSLYISDPQYGSLGYEGYGGWNIVQARYMLAFLFEYAATLGIIDVAYIPPSRARPDYGEMWGTDDLDCLSRYDGLLFLRINNLGAWCLELAEAYVPAPLTVQQAVRVLPNMEVVATTPLDPGDVLLLEQFAERISDVVWKIQLSRLLEALEHGQSVGGMEEFLRSRAGGILPGTVEVFFKDMADRASRLVDRGPARLVEAQDAALAQLIANDGRLRSLCLVAGERHLVIPADGEAAFRRALHDLGYSLPPFRGNK